MKSRYAISWIPLNSDRSRGSLIKTVRRGFLHHHSLLSLFLSLFVPPCRLYLRNCFRHSGNNFSGTSSSFPSDLGNPRMILPLEHICLPVQISCTAATENGCVLGSCTLRPKLATNINTPTIHPYQRNCDNIRNSYISAKSPIFNLKMFFPDNLRSRNTPEVKTSGSQPDIFQFTVRNDQYRCGIQMCANVGGGPVQVSDRRPAFAAIYPRLYGGRSRSLWM